jgi:hypothetical protein
MVSAVVSAVTEKPVLFAGGKNCVTWLGRTGYPFHSQRPRNGFHVVKANPQSFENHTMKD